MATSDNQLPPFSLPSVHNDIASSMLLRLVLAGAIGLAMTVALLDPFGAVRSGVLCLAAAVLLVISAIYTSRHHEWLICALILIEVLTSCSTLPDNFSTAGRYGLEGLFCLPVIPAYLRSHVWSKGGFRLFWLYMAWSIITVSYSVAPLFSLGRILNTSLLVATVSLCASEITNRRDLYRLLGRALLACAIVIALLCIAAVALPSSITWISGEIVNDSGRVVFSRGGIPRYQGFLTSPNQVGEAMLVTIALELIYWKAALKRGKIALMFMIALASGLIAIADSRTSAAAILVGAGAYAIFKYRLRAFLVCVGLFALAVMWLVFASPRLSRYVSRDATSFTGRSEIWSFTISQIEQSPLLGYGYEVEGAILDNKYFPLWYGPWDKGPHSSLHEDYLARAVGVGVPAALLWLFIMLRPWIVVFRNKTDPLDLKGIGLLAALPVFILNFAESSAGDCRYTVGLLFMLAWALAENHRLTLIDPMPIPETMNLFAPAS